MNKISGVYLIKNIITNDCYVGSSIDVKRRWADHKCLRTWKRYFNNQLYIDMQAIGKDKFSFEILEECDKSILRIRENFYINKLKPTYNSQKAFRTPEECRKQHIEVSKKWHQKHREQTNIASRKYYWSHKEQYCESKRQYRAKRKAESLKVEPTK